MNIYEIIMTPDAIDDLRELRDYIADVLHAPDAALTHIRVLRTEIGTLATMPERHKCVNDEPWGSYGIRRIAVKNFVVYYRIDDASHRVYILNIIYAKRDQMCMLAQIKMDV